MKGNIYCIENIINNKKYVGKTSFTIEERWLSHKQDSTKRNFEIRPLYRAFKKYGIENFKIYLLEECPLELLDNKEIEWIEELDTYKNGYNATLGGEGTILYDHEEIIEVYKEGGTMKETANIIGCSKDTVFRVLKLHNTDKNVVSIDYDKSCINRPIEVSQYNLNGKFIRKFNSVADAARWLFENKYIKKLQSGVRSHISNCARGKQKQAYKFIWKYE